MKKLLITGFVFAATLSAVAQNVPKPPKPPHPPTPSETEITIPVPAAPAEAPVPPEAPVHVDELIQDDYKLFLKKNPGVRSLSWKESSVIVKLKSGKQEQYYLNDEKSIKQAESKYGELPAPPPPPPLPLPVPKRVKA